MLHHDVEYSDIDNSQRFQASHYVYYKFTYQYFQRINHTPILHQNHIHNTLTITMSAPMNMNPVLTSADRQLHVASDERDSNIVASMNPLGVPRESRPAYRPQPAGSAPEIGSATPNLDGETASIETPDQSFAFLV